MNKSILFAAGLSAMMVGCSGSGPVKGELGKPIEIDGNKITVKAGSYSILSDDTDEISLVAPEDKVYLKLSFASSDQSFFTSLFNGETELEPVDGMMVADYTLLTENLSESIFLIDKNTDSLKVKIKDYGDNVGEISVTDFSDQSDRKVSDKMLAFQKDFDNPIGILDAIQKYTSKDVYSIVSQKGVETPFNPKTRELKFRYVGKDGNYFECQATSLGKVKLEVWWENDEIVKAVFED